MQHINKAVQVESKESEIISKASMGLVWTSKYCYKHIPEHKTSLTDDISHLQAVSERFRVEMVLQEGKMLCPFCELARWQKIEEAKVQAIADEIKAKREQAIIHEKKNVLDKQSIITDETVRAADFSGFKTDYGLEEAENKKRAEECARRFLEGEQFNLWIYSPRTGVGKSHLGMAILKELNKTNKYSCLFVDVDEMLRWLRSSFDDKSSIYTEKYFVDLLSSVDFLVLDDLGAETGDIKTDKRASEFTNRILKAVQNGRQHKSTIITTNLGTQQLSNIYDGKVVSRLMKRIMLIKFSEAVDKRIGNAGF